MPIFEGFLAGFAMIVFVGPVLFTILQISLEKGILAGSIAAFGVFISDIVCVAICYWGSKKFVHEIENSYWISILGSIILFSIGFTYIFKPNLQTKANQEVNKLSLFKAFTKGYLVNFVNPFVFGVWLTVIAIAKQKYSFEEDILTYLLAATLAVLLTDTIKVFFADYLRNFLKPSVLKKIYKISGVLLILFGIRILIQTI